MDRDRSVNPKPSLSKLILRETSKNTTEQPTADLKRSLTSNFPTKDGVEDTNLSLRKPFLPKTASLVKNDAEKVALSSSITETPIDTVPIPFTSKEVPEISKENSEETAKKQRGFKKGRFDGRSGKFSLSEDIPQEVINARFPEDFDFEVEYLPDRPQSPIEEFEPFSKLLDEVPDPKPAFEETYIPFSLDKLDSSNLEFSGIEPISINQSLAPLAADDSTLPSDKSGSSLDLSKGYLFEIDPPYFDESKTFTLLEDPLHE